MQLPSLTREQVRRIDQIAIEDYSMPGIVLMENAGRGASELIDRVARDGLITILCGSGNNAGDGYVIARHLQLMGHPVRIVALVDLEALSGDAAVNATIARKARIDVRPVDSRESVIAAIANARTIVDAVLGTGAKGAPRGLFADAIRSANDQASLRIAIDLPTGLDCDTGIAHEPTFRADHTVTFVAPKVGFTKNHAEQYVGVVSVVGIGVPQRLLEDVLAW